MRLLLRRYRLILHAMSGFSALVVLLGGQIAFASGTDALVHAVSAPEMANVLASTRNASLAAEKMVGASSAAVAQSMNMAQDRFEGKFDATPHH